MARPSGEVIKLVPGKRYRLPVRVYQGRPWCRLDLPMRVTSVALACAAACTAWRWLGAAVKTSSWSSPRPVRSAAACLG